MTLIQAASGTSAIPAWVTLASSIVAVTAAIITIIGNYRIKQQEFRNEYRKFILKKRQEVYDNIEALINNIFYNGNIWEYINEPKAQILQDIEGIVYAINQFNKKTLWMSPQIIEELSRTKTFLNYIIPLLADPNYKQGKEEYGPKLEKLTNMFNERHYKIRKVFIDDIMKLDNLRAFRKWKQKQHTAAIKSLDE